MFYNLQKYNIIKKENIYNNLYRITNDTEERFFIIRNLKNQ